MAEVYPLRAWFYDEKKVGQLARVVCPPYDVIDAAQTQIYQQLHPANIIRLVLGKTLGRTGRSQEDYEQAGRLFQEWIAAGVLRQAAAPTMYVYRQDYRLGDEPERSLTGFLALLRLEEWGKGQVHPHEETLGGPRRDRLELLRACRANFCPIFALYQDPGSGSTEKLQEVGRDKPEMDIRDERGTRHRIWAIKDRETVEFLQARLLPLDTVIADGHHRYQSALTFSRELHCEGQEEPTAETHNHILALFVDLKAPGISILAAHRLVRQIPRERIDLLAKRAAPYFLTRKVKTKGSVGENIQALMGEMRRQGEQTPTFAAIAPGGYQLLLLLRDKDRLRPLLKHAAEMYPRLLDVTIAHRVILEHLLEAADDQSSISYHTDPVAIAEGLASGKGALALLLNPTQREQVWEIATAGRRLPGKATYFYPKPLSGLVINRLSEKSVASFRKDSE